MPRYLAKIMAGYQDNWLLKHGRITRQLVIGSLLLDYSAKIMAGYQDNWLSKHGQIMRLPVVKTGCNSNHGIDCFHIRLAGYRGTTVLLWFVYRVIIEESRVERHSPVGWGVPAEEDPLAGPWNT